MRINFRVLWSLGFLVALITGAGAKTIPVATSGDDTSGDGSNGNPYQTIQKAIDEAAIFGDKMAGAAGTYRESIYGIDEEDPPVDYSLWTVESFTHPDSTWTVTANTATFTDARFDARAVFYSDFSVLNQRITGQVTLPATDDDFWGFVLGYQPGDNNDDGANYYVIDWKQGDQNFNWGAGSVLAERGLALSEVQGIPDQTAAWSHTGAFTELAEGTTLGDTGWADNTTYRFELLYEPNRIQFWVDGSKEFDLAGSFPDGRFGFYDFSQASVIWSNEELPEWQPDLLIKQGPTWLGDDIYNADGTDQTAASTKGGSQTAVFKARLVNDGSTTENFWVQGPAGNADWTVQYYAGTAVIPAKEVTAKVTSGNGWKRGDVPAGGTRKFVIAVTPTAGTRGSYGALVTAYAEMDPAQVDAILANTTVPDVQPDLHLKKGPIWGGDDIYNDDGTDQKAVRKVTAGSPALFKARLENDGTVKDHFYIKGPVGDADWTVQYYQGLKVDVSKEVTAEVTSAEGWKRPNVAPGKLRSFLMVVTPRSGLPVDSKYVALVQAEARRDASQLDTIKTITRVKTE